MASYFEMLRAQLIGKPYSKTDFRRRLLPHLNERSEQSVEFKYANISAILIELGFPFVVGYKPRSNYQRLLFDVVSRALAASSSLHDLAEIDSRREAKAPSVEDILSALRAPPKPMEVKNRIASPVGQYVLGPVNYLAQEAANRSLGRAGEEFVVNFERARLIHAGASNLASKIEHISVVKGDGAGFDVLSFESTGEERLIEVKTTKYGALAPFYVSRNELKVSEINRSKYFLYRVFEFGDRPLLFNLRGALSATCALDAVSYAARVRQAID